MQYICIHVRVCVHARVYIYQYIYIYIYICMHLCICLCWISICELRGSDGSVLDETDAVNDVADDMEELVGIIRSDNCTICIYMYVYVYICEHDCGNNADA